VSKPKVRTVSRSDINEKNLLTFVQDGWLPIPKSIIPPRRKAFLWKTLPLPSYDSSRDYQGKLLDNLRSAIHRTIHEWGDADGIDRVGVWLSGGIDSSTVAALSVHALGKERVLGLLMPEKDSSEDTYALSKQAADSLGIVTVYENITPILDAVGCYKRRDEALRSVIEGHVDLVTNMIPKDTLKVAVSPHSKVVKGRQDVRWTAGYLNLMSPHTLPLRTLRVREALNYAVNKKELFRYAFKGNAVEMRGMLTEKSGVDLSDTKPYDWNVPKARELLKEAGYGEGFKMTLFYQERDYLIAYLLRRFYSLLKIEVEITPVKHEWFVRHVVYPNTRDGYPWEDEDWWILISSHPGQVPEVMGGMLEWFFHSGAPWQTAHDWLGVPLDRMYHEVLRTKDRTRRFQIYKRANEYIADQALHVFTMAPLSLYGVNEEVDFVPQLSQYLYLDYSSVSDKHWSIRGQKK